VLIAGFAAALVFLPRAALAVAVGALIAAAAFEWARLCRLPAWPYAAAMAAAYAGGFLTGQAFAFFALAAAFWIVAVPLWLWHGVRSDHSILLAAAGFLLLVPAALALVTLAPGMILLVLALVWIADSAAYFVGIRLGRRKLAPSISPGKTWEGALGGVAGALVYAIICGFLIEGIPWVPYLAAAVLLAVISIVGDLFESAAKRRAGVKDSGSLLPGHGGILDRIDSATAVLPLAALMAFWIMGK
jgi:phosphatidate cytidylyltransferase